MTCNDEYILSVALLAAIFLVKAMEKRHREASGCVQMSFMFIYSAEGLVAALFSSECE